MKMKLPAGFNDQFLKLLGIILVIYLILQNYLPMVAIFVIPIIAILPELYEIIMRILEGEEHKIVMIESGFIKDVFGKRIKSETIKIYEIKRHVSLDRKFHLFTYNSGDEIKLGDSGELHNAHDFDKIISSEIIEKLFTTRITDIIYYVLYLGIGLLTLNAIMFYLLNNRIMEIINAMK